jgi:hypothetical protein
LQPKNQKQKIKSCHKKTKLNKVRNISKKKAKTKQNKTTKLLNEKPTLFSEDDTLHSKLQNLHMEKQGGEEFFAFLAFYH